jgi:predicted transport protein
VELYGAKTVVYRVYEFFLEVIPRRGSLTLLLNLDVDDLQQLPDGAWDASKNEFIVNASEDGGVAFTLKSKAGLPTALALIHAAYANVSS